MEKYAVVIISFDGYRDVWNTFFECYEKFWNDRSFNTYLVTNNYVPQYNNVQVITTGDEKSWSFRVRTALNQIPEENVLVLLEDYFLCENVDDKKVNEIYREFINQELDYLRVIPIPFEYKHKQKGIYPLDDKFVYGVNLQAAFWKKTYLKKLLFEDDFSAWEFEARQKSDSRQKIQGRCATLNYVGLNYLNGVIQGKWYPQTIKQMKNLGIVIPTQKRKIIKHRKLFLMDLQNWMLHHIPRKIIKKCKPLFRKIGFKFVTED